MPIPRYNLKPLSSNDGYRVPLSMQDANLPSPDGYALPASLGFSSSNRQTLGSLLSSTRHLRAILGILCIELEIVVCDWEPVLAGSEGSRNAMSFERVPAPFARDRFGFVSAAYLLFFPIALTF